MKHFLYSICIILIVATFSICALKPNMHKTILVFDSAYTLNPKTQVEEVKEVIPIMEKVSTPVKTVRRVNDIQNTEEKKSTKQDKIITSSKQPAKVVKTISEETTQKTKKINQVTSKTQKPLTDKKVEQKVEQVKPIKVQKTKENVLTQKEEEIAWNIWRSNLQNKIMQDVKLPIIPNGIVFKFSFSVDKFGKISNVQTWSTSPAYTPYAIQYIAPVIRSYQGKSILNFPLGTHRTVTDVSGGWKISESERYSTPQDYNDVERIRTY